MRTDFLVAYLIKSVNGNSEVRHIRRSVSKRLWERADYRQAVSIGVRNSSRIAGVGKVVEIVVK
jgi:hypothetical protein